MAATATGSSRRTPNGPVLHPISPSGRFHFPKTPSSSSTAFAYSSSSFTSHSPTFFNSHNHHQNQLQRSASPTRVSLYGNTPSTPSVRFSTVSSRNNQVVRKQSNTTVKKTCMCSPTTHPGSFRCSLHKNLNSSPQHPVNHNRLNARRSAMTNSLVRIGVEGDLVKRALASLIRPSSHQQRRRAAFQSRPSRLSVMSKSEECGTVGMFVDSVH